MDERLIKRLVNWYSFIVIVIISIYILDYSITKTNELNEYAVKYGEDCYIMNNLTIPNKSRIDSYCMLNVKGDNIRVSCSKENNKTNCGLVILNKV